MKQKFLCSQRYYCWLLLQCAICYQLYLNNLVHISSLNTFRRGRDLMTIILAAMLNCAKAKIRVRGIIPDEAYSHLSPDNGYIGLFSGTVSGTLTYQWVSQYVWIETLVRRVKNVGWYIHLLNPLNTSPDSNRFLIFY